MVSPEFERLWLMNNPFCQKPDQYFVQELQGKPMGSQGLRSLFVNWGGALRRRAMESAMKESVQ